MAYDLGPENALIFRITHRDNVPWILDHGIQCRNSTEVDPNFVAIGMRDLIERRRAHHVRCRLGGTLADYVPYRTVAKLGLPFVFTDRHAVLSTAQVFSDLRELDKIDWAVIRRRDFRRDPEDPGKVERYEAEALIHRHVPINSLYGIACYNDDVKRILVEKVNERNVKLDIATKPNRYF